MTDCADSTSLRAHLDEPDATLDAHLDACATCTGLLHAVAADAGYTARALALLDPAGGADDAHVDVEAALAAACAEVTAAPLVPVPAPPGRRLASVGRRLSLAAAAALVVVVVAVTPAGRSAVAEVLDAFRGERLEVVTVDMEAWSVGPDGLQVLEALGDVDTSELVEPERVAGVAEAAAIAGIGPPALAEVPDRVVAMAPGTARLVLAARDGNDVPAELDGAALVVDVPGAIGAIYGSPGSIPELVVARSGPLVVRAEGAPLEEIRSFLLSRDELPADLRAQLAAIDDWRSTIPVPVPLDGPGWEEVDVAGRPALAFGDDSGLGALVIRQDPDGVTVVGGRLSVSRALEIAARA